MDATEGKRVSTSFQSSVHLRSILLYKTAQSCFLCVEWKTVGSPN